MEVLNTIEFNYYNNIIDKKTELIDLFIYDFIADFIRKSLNNVRNKEDINNLLTSYEESKDSSFLNNKVIIDFLKEKYMNEISNNLNRTIIEIVNSIILYKCDAFNLYIYRVLHKLVNEIPGFTSDLFVLPSQRYIKLIEYKLFTFSDKTQLIDFGREILKVIANLFFIFYNKDENYLDDSFSTTHAGLTERVIKLYNIFVHEVFINMYNELNIADRQDFVYKKFNDVNNVLNKNINLDDNSNKEDIIIRKNQIDKEGFKYYFRPIHTYGNPSLFDKFINDLESVLPNYNNSCILALSEFLFDSEVLLPSKKPSKAQFYRIFCELINRQVSTLKPNQVKTKYDKINERFWYLIIRN